MSYQRLTKQENTTATTETTARENAPTYEELYERLTELEDKIEEVAEQIKKSLYTIYGDCNTPQIDIIIEDVIHDIDKLSEELKK